jgi:hypothetical protein
MDQSPPSQSTTPKRQQKAGWHLKNYPFEEVFQLLARVIEEMLHTLSPWRDHAFRFQLRDDAEVEHQGIIKVEVCKQEKHVQVG